LFFRVFFGKLFGALRDEDFRLCLCKNVAVVGDRRPNGVSLVGHADGFPGLDRVAAFAGGLGVFGAANNEIARFFDIAKNLADFENEEAVSLLNSMKSNLLKRFL